MILRQTDLGVRGFDRVIKISGSYFSGFEDLRVASRELVRVAAFASPPSRVAAVLTPSESRTLLTSTSCTGLQSRMYAHQATSAMKAGPGIEEAPSDRVAEEGQGLGALPGTSGHHEDAEQESLLTRALLAFEGGDPNSNVEVFHEEEEAQKWFSWRTLLSYTGPGFLMCIAYLDPGNLEADLQVGAYTGYSLVWLLLLATCMGLVLQCMAARLGVVTGKHLATVCREEYGRKTSLTLWLMIEAAIIGSDMQEIIGSAIAFQVLFGLPLWVGCLITLVDTFTFLGVHYFGVRKLEAVFVALVATMTVCFFVNVGVSPPPSLDVAKGFVPVVHKYAVQSAVGLIGAVIMPHNLYLHSALVLSRKIDRTSPRQVREANKYLAIDSSIALLVSFLINLAVVAVFSFHFFSPYCATLDSSQPLACLAPGLTGDGGGETCVMASGKAGTCQEIGLAHADEALKDALGSVAKYVWGVGLLAAGQSSTMTGTYAGQYVMEGFLDLKIPIWARVLFTRLVAIGPGILVAIFTQGDQQLSDAFQEWINILQSIQLTFALLPVLHFTSSKKIMGRYVNSPGTSLVVWVLAFLLLLINIYLAIFKLGGAHQRWYAYLIFAVFGLVYIAFSASLVGEDFKRAWAWAKGKWQGGGGEDEEKRRELASPLIPDQLEEEEDGRE